MTNYGVYLLAMTLKAVYWHRGELVEGKIQLLKFGVATRPKTGTDIGGIDARIREHRKYAEVCELERWELTGEPITPENIPDHLERRILKMLAPFRMNIFRRDGSNYVCPTEMMIFDWEVLHFIQKHFATVPGYRRTINVGPTHHEYLPNADPENSIPPKEVMRFRQTTHRSIRKAPEIQAPIVRYDADGDCCME